jgi:hypothetical protein
MHARVHRQFVYFASSITASVTVLYGTCHAKLTQPCIRQRSSRKTF